MQFFSAAEAAAPLTRMGSEVSAKRSLALALEGRSVTSPPSLMTFTRFSWERAWKEVAGILGYGMEFGVDAIPPSKAELTAVTRTLSP